MKYLKMLSLAAIAAVAAMAFVGAGTASAAPTVLCEVEVLPCAESAFPAGTVLEASSTESLLKSNLGNVNCKKSTTKGKTTAESGEPLPGLIESLTFSECTLVGTGTSCTATAVHLPYKATVKWTSGFNGTMTVTSDGSGAPGATVVCGSVISCTFTAEGVELDAQGGSPAHVVAKEEPLGHESGAICPTTASWTSTYTLTGATSTIFVSHL